jgi:hypothetical protein
MVDRNSTVAGHDAEQLGLLGPLPATDAGANRCGHRNRLTRWQRAELLIPRLPSQDDSQVPLWRNPPAFAASRRKALTGWEVQPPLGPEVPANPLSSTFPQRIPYALERPQGLPIDAF